MCDFVWREPWAGAVHSPVEGACAQLCGGRIGRVDPSGKVNFANICPEKMGTNTLLCRSGCLTAVLPERVFVRKQRTCSAGCAGSPTGRGSPLGGGEQVPISPEITCEPAPAGQMLTRQRCVDAEWHQPLPSPAAAHRWQEMLRGQGGTWG